MSCPKGDQYCAVSCIISPVTQEALVEVNNASKKGAPLPSFVENGSISRQAPINIIVAKLRIIICPGNAFHTFFKHKTTYPNILKHSTLVCIKIL